MSLFLPFQNQIQPQYQKICGLCDLPAAYLAIIKIRIFDPATNKLVATELDLAVCEQHADRMDIQIDKILKLEKKAIVIFAP